NASAVTIQQCRPSTSTSYCRHCKPYDFQNRTVRSELWTSPMVKASTAFPQYCGKTRLCYARAVGNVGRSSFLAHILQFSYAVILRTQRRGFVWPERSCWAVFKRKFRRNPGWIYASFLASDGTVSDSRQEVELDMLIDKRHSWALLM